MNRPPLGICTGCGQRPASVDPFPLCRPCVALIEPEVVHQIAGIGWRAATARGRIFRALLQWAAGIMREPAAAEFAATIRANHALPPAPPEVALPNQIETEGKPDATHGG